MATESIAEQIAARIELILSQIDPATDPEYWYKPDRAVRVDVMDVRIIDNARQYKGVICVAPGDEFEQEKTSGTIDHMMDIFVLTARQWTVAETDPFVRTSDILKRWTLQNRLIRDLIRCLTKDVQLANLCINMELRDITRDFDIPQGWAIAAVRLAISYDHTKDMP